jgi:two-component system OmpR family response regulator
MTYAPPPRLMNDWQGKAIEPDSPGTPHIPVPWATRTWHVLVVDDDPALRDMITDFLSAQDIRVSTAADGQQMANVLAAGGVDLAVLDLQLGRESGIDIMRSVRTACDLPIILITGQHRDEVDRIVGLELGADDYVTKPFSPRELLARIRAVLRRSEQRSPRQGQEKEVGKRVRYRFAGWEVSLRNRRLTSPSGETVRLTRGEFALLVAFVQAPRRVLTREHLLASGRVHDSEVFDRSIDVQILRLRRKIEADSAAPKLIRTERGVGYVFTPAVEVV